MPSPLSEAGAIAEPSAYAPLHTNRFMTGLWTNRNQLRDAATSFLYEKFYSATRFDSLIGGSNCELTQRMTMARRAGHSVYNSQTFQTINRFYSFNQFSTDDESIRVMADAVDAIYDATGPDTKLNIWNKSAGAGDTTFQSVGNNLFFGNTKDQKKWVTSLPGWTANYSGFSSGQLIDDSNNNLQVAYGGLQIGVVAVQVLNNQLSLTLDPEDPDLPTNLMSLVGMSLTLSGFTGATFLNGLTVVIGTVPQGMPAYTSNVVQLAFIEADYGPVEETGEASTGDGTTGGTEPGWNTQMNSWTLDGGEQWQCKGASVENWGIAPPLKAPTVVQSTLPVIYPSWAAGNYYSTCYLIYNSANVIQMVTGFGTTGSVEPTWNNTAGDTTSDATVVWTSKGVGTRMPNFTYAKGDYIFAPDSSGINYFFKCVSVAGPTANMSPVFTSAMGSQVIDGGATWANIGVGQTWNNIASSSIVGNFVVIPITGGGTIAIGTGQGATNGTQIALPTGYTASNLLAWSTPGVGFTPSGVVVEGVYTSTSSGGNLSSFFQANFGGPSVAATNNWIAATWSADATVTVTTIGGCQYGTFTTLAGDTLCICAGSVADGADVAVPGTFLAANFLSIVGMAGADNPGHVMQGVELCELNSGLTFSGQYSDEDENKWHGPGNVFGVFYTPGGGVTTETVTGGTAMIIPTTPGETISLLSARVASGGSFGLPSGFAGAQIFATGSMTGWTLHSNSHAHGWSVTTSGTTATGFYTDDAGVDYPGFVSVFAVLAALDVTPINPAQTVVDSNGNLQTIVVSGVAGATAPAWAINEGAQTQDNNAVWRDTGITTAARTEPSAWAFCWKSSMTNHVSTASPISTLVTLDANNFAFLQGPGSPDLQVDTIVIGRWAQGGSILLYEDEIPAPPPGQLWQYQDQLPDSYLNPQLPLPINKSNNPPPVGFKPMEYHLSRIWGAVGNVLNWSNGTNQLGDPNQSYQPLNFYTLPSKITRCWACTLGLIVFTVSDVYIVTGSATDADPLIPPVKYIPKLGLLSYDAFTLNKTTPYIMDNVKRIMALDPSAGLIEPGFPIADQLDELYDASTAQLAWLDGQHGDTALFAGNSTGDWFRMAALSAPEQGLVWSPKGTLAAGFKAMNSIEVLPGQTLLLLGPATEGPILFRDTTVNTDNGVQFPWFPIIGSIVLAQPGQLAELSFLTLEGRRRGTRPTVGILLGEIDGAISGTFDTLYRTRQDPPLLPQSDTLFNDRYDVMQNQQSVWCRHLQIRIDYKAEDVYNELLTYTIFGAIHNELRSQ